MSDTDESYLEPLTIHPPKPSVESVKSDANSSHVFKEAPKLSDSSTQNTPPPSVDYEKKSLYTNIQQSPTEAAIKQIRK